MLALAAGVPLGQYYQLYYVLPFTQQQATLQLLVQRILLGVGLAVVVLLAAIASLVTRRVVVPVRHAAKAAQRLSAGHLGERMEVLGVDDLAALATSFNRMAASLEGKLSELEELSHVQRQFVSDVSHELRTPLSTIKMAADLLFELPRGARPGQATGPRSCCRASWSGSSRCSSTWRPGDQQVRRRRGHPGRRTRRRV